MTNFFTLVKLINNITNSVFDKCKNCFHNVIIVFRNKYQIKSELATKLQKNLSIIFCLSILFFFINIEYFESI